MEAAAINEVEQTSDPAGRRLLQQQQKNEELELAPALLEIQQVGIFKEIDEQLVILSEAANALVDTSAYSVVTAKSDAALIAHEFVACSQNQWVSREPRSTRLFWLFIQTGVLLAALGFGWFGAAYWYQHFDTPDELTGLADINAVAERIIEVESNGDPNEKNSRSSATGVGQFIDETWLALIRRYRPELTRGRSESEILALRREAKLAHDLTTRLVERNAAILRQRHLPVTAGSIYLAHFAGVRGAVAILSASEKADAALVMANADSTGRIKREQIIKANPFLEHLTISDLKIWADRKMRGPGHQRDGRQRKKVKY